MDDKSQNPNVYKTVPYGRDIEGVWSYLYFSYRNGESVGYIKLGDDEVKRVDFQVTHN